MNIKNVEKKEEARKTIGTVRVEKERVSDFSYERRM